MRGFRRKLFFITVFLPILSLLFTGCGNEGFRISISGDILFDRGVRDKIAVEGPSYLFKNVKEELLKSKIVFANLECPISQTGIPVYKKRKELVFNGDRATIPAMKSAGINILNLANNHTMDYGRKGILDTINNLNSSGIRTVGAGCNRKEAHKPVIIKKSGVTIGFLGYSTFPPEGHFYLEGKPDVAYSDEKKLAEEIASAKAQCDILIVSFHWGNEFSFKPTGSQRNLAHLSIDSGADLIIGQHPHVLQGIEEYKGKNIFYSMGSFIFDKQRQPRTAESVLLNVDISRNGIGKTELIPIKITDCQPRMAGIKAATAILKRLMSYSCSINITIDKKSGKGYIENTGTMK